MMNPWLVTGLSVLYIGVLFLLAWQSKRWKFFSRPEVRAWIYPLSMGVYCTAWTFYGSVGKASRDGLEFLAVFIGPTLTAPLWWIVLRKMIRISQVQRTSTIADFISSRYGKSVSVASIVTLMCFLGIIPYIALQLKAISESFNLITGGGLGSGKNDFFHNTALYVALFMAAFTILFGARKTENYEKHNGIVVAVAFESVIKLLAFLTAGIVLIYGIFGGLSPLFTSAMEFPEVRKNLVLPEQGGMGEWFWVSSLSALSIILLPRQFLLAVVENDEEQHVRNAMWVFPTYLFLINLFVLPLAIAGMLTFQAGTVDPDYFILQLPLHFNMPALAILVFIGGISAATSMIIVETMALSTMFTNHLLFPVLVGVESIKDRIAPHVSAI
ncbi:MAG TPA: histidine kinase, partial [Catalimonadaceae bacterium]|nr:histidine kinase [Catalimonadaceae bacterium]